MHGCNSPTNCTESQSPLHQLLLNLFSFFMSPRSLSHPISIPLAAYPLTRVVAHLDWTLILQTLITGFPSLSHKHDKVNQTSFFFSLYIFLLRCLVLVMHAIPMQKWRAQLMKPLLPRKPSAKSKLWKNTVLITNKSLFGSRKKKERIKTEINKILYWTCAFY